MTPEEIQRTFDFIIQHQARFEAAIERDREERLEQWKRDQPRIAQVEAAVIRLKEIAEIQSRRLDQHDRDIRRILKRSPEEG